MSEEHEGTGASIDDGNSAALPAEPNQPISGDSDLPKTGDVEQAGQVVAESPELPADQSPLRQLADEAIANAENVPAQQPADEGATEAEVKPNEPWAGEYTPNANIDLALPILEEFSEAELKKFSANGSILLSNMSTDELDAISASIQFQIDNKQEERRALASKGAAGNYYGLEAPDGKGGINVVYVTDAERLAIGTIGEYEKSLRTSADPDLFEDGSEWTNLPALGDKKIAIGKLDYSKHKDPMIRIQGKLGLATQYTNPMWHSGLHLVIEGAGALEELSLSQRISQDKIEYGRESSGYVYGASALYLNRPVIEFGLQHVKACTAGTTDPEELKDLLLITDIEPLALGLASTLYPDGYLLERPCLTDQGGCGYVVKRKVNLRRMLMVRRSKISDDQFRLMDKRTGFVDTSRIREYQRTMRMEVPRLVEIDEGTFLRFRVPTIAQYERLASTWLETMDRRARAVGSSNANQRQREAYLAKASAIAVVMAYGHWIDAVLETVENEVEPVVIVERLDSGDPEAQLVADERLEKLLTAMASKPELTDKISEALGKFITAMTISTPVVPKVICPQCQKPVTGDSTSRHPHLVNVNAVELFFTLLHQRIRTLV